MSKFVPYIQDKVEKCDGKGDTVLVYMKKGAVHFNHLLIKKKHSFEFFDFEPHWEFTASVVISKEMDSHLKELYRKLKNYDCELNWAGFRKIFSRPTFRCSKFLSQLKGEISQIEPNDEFAAVLNSDESLVKLIKDTKPDVIDIGLYVPMPPPLPDAIKLLKMYYLNPQELTWLVKLETCFSTILNYKKHFLKIFQIEDAISEKVFDFTKKKGNVLVLRRRNSKA